VEIAVDLDAQDSAGLFGQTCREASGPGADFEHQVGPAQLGTADDEIE